MRRSDYFLIPFLMDGALSMGQLMSNLKALDLGATPFQLGLLGFAWGLPFAAFGALAGHATKRYDRRWIIVLGALFYGLSVVFYGFATRTEHIIAVAGLGGLGNALFWPCFETLLHTHDPKETHARMTLFNVGWASGLMCGSGLGGYVYAWLGPRWAFWVVFLIVFGNIAYLAGRVKGGIAGPTEDEEEIAPSVASLSPKRQRGYVYLAWVANFTLFYASSAASTMFPKLARTFRISDGAIGILLAMVTVAQTACFALLSRSARWQYRFSPLILMQIMGIVGLAAMTAGSSYFVFAVGLGLIGFSRGLTYSASLFYGLQDKESHGMNNGIHEGIIGAAFVIGPVLSGFAAERASLRTPFEVCIAVLLVGMVVELAMWRRLPD
jgi:MFS family permease